MLTRTWAPVLAPDLVKHEGCYFILIFRGMVEIPFELHGVARRHPGARGAALIHLKQLADFGYRARLSVLMVAEICS